MRVSGAKTAGCTAPARFRLRLPAIAPWPVVALSLRASCACDARVRRRREYLAIGRTAQRRQTRHFVVLSARRDDGTRLGVTVSRKIGGAVVRNAVKRRVREAFRRNRKRLLPGHDFVVIAKPGAGSPKTPMTADYKAEFDKRYILVTKENVDDLLPLLLR